MNVTIYKSRGIYILQASGGYPINTRSKVIINDFLTPNLRQSVENGEQITVEIPEVVWDNYWKSIRTNEEAVELNSQTKRK